MLSESELSELRKQCEDSIARPVIRWVDIDPRTLIRLLNEIESSRVAGLVFERKLLDPAHRD